MEVWCPKHWVCIFYCGKINHSLDVQFSRIKYIHMAVQPSSQFISRTFSPPPNEMLSPLKLALFEVATFVVNYKQQWKTNTVSKAVTFFTVIILSE